MLGIFKDERHRTRPIAPNPLWSIDVSQTHVDGTGRICPPVALRLLGGAPLHLHSRALPGGQIRLRRSRAVMLNRP